MSEEIKELLDGAIKREILGLENLEIASEKKGDAIEDLVKLYRLRIEETKAEMDYREKRESRIMDVNEKKEARFMEHDAESRKIQENLSEQVKDRYLKIGIAIAEIGVPIVFYAMWMDRGFTFEQTGTYTSKTFMNLINRFKPTKK